MEKKSEIVSQYVSDMHVLEKHIQEALEKQVPQTADQPEINRALQQYVNTTRRHVTRLEQRLQELGNQDSIVDKAKEGITNLFGQAAGAIDLVRTHPVAKDLRDDYTAGSLAVISYVMLKTTALACDDQQTAQLAETHLTETIQMLQWIARTIPTVVVHDLQEERDVQFNAGAARQVANDPKLSYLYGSQASQAVTTSTD